MSQYYYQLATDFFCPSGHYCELMPSLDACQKEYQENRYANCSEVQTKLIGMIEKCGYESHYCASCPVNTCPQQASVLPSSSRYINVWKCHMENTGEVLGGPTKGMATIRYRTLEEWYDDNAETLKALSTLAVGAFAVGILAFSTYKTYQCLSKCKAKKAVTTYFGSYKSKMMNRIDRFKNRIFNVYNNFSKKDQSP